VRFSLALLDEAFSRSEISVMYGAMAVPDWIQSTDLIEAVKFNRLEEVSWRLRMGENVNKQLSCGRTALHWATAYNYFECARILMDCRPNLSLKDNRGNTSLHVAASTGSGQVSVSLVQLLLEQGAEKDVQNNLGRTPLHEATIHGNEEIMEKLLLSGARREMRDWEGNTASDWAIRNNNVSLARILSCGGQPVQTGLGLDLMSIINNVAGENSGELSEASYGHEMGEKSKNSPSVPREEQVGHNTSAEAASVDAKEERSCETKYVSLCGRKDEIDKRDGACAGTKDRASYGIIKMIMDGASGSEKDGTSSGENNVGGSDVSSKNGIITIGAKDGAFIGVQHGSTNVEKDDVIKYGTSSEEKYGTCTGSKDEDSGKSGFSNESGSSSNIRKYLSGSLTPEEEWKFLIERLAELEMDESRQIKTEKRELKSKLDLKMGLLITKKQRFKQEKTDLEAEIGQLVRNLETIKASEEKETRDLEKEIRDISQKLEDTKSKSNKSNKQIVNAIKMESILECPVCLDICKPPIQVWQCPEGHIICGRCAARPELLVCPQCRQPVDGKMSRNRALEDLSSHIFPASEHVGVVSPQGPQPRPPASRYGPGMMTPTSHTPPMWEHIWNVMPMYQSDYGPGHVSSSLFPNPLNNMESYFRPIHAQNQVPTPTIPNPNSLPSSSVPASNSVLPTVQSIMSTLPPLPAPRVLRGRGGGRGRYAQTADGFASIDQINQWMDALTYEEPIVAETARIPIPQSNNSIGDGNQGFGVLAPVGQTLSRNTIGEANQGFSLLAPFNPSRDATGGIHAPYNPAREVTGSQPWNPSRNLSDDSGMQPYNSAIARNHRDAVGMQPYTPTRETTGAQLYNSSRDSTGMQPYNSSRNSTGMQPYNSSRSSTGMQPYNPARDGPGIAANRAPLRSSPSDVGGQNSNGFYNWPPSPQW